MSEMVISDVQGRADVRGFPIARVGISNVAFYGNIKWSEQPLTASGRCDCYASLSRDKKGTHMSRMARSVQGAIDKQITSTLLKDTAVQLLQWLETDRLMIELRLECIRPKLSPVTKLAGYEPFNIAFFTTATTDECATVCEITFTGTSLCPASKENSEFGAHNQRSIVDIKIPFEDSTNIEEILSVAESCLSSPVYPILKLEDEKIITEQAYLNPMFVEDIVRNIATTLKQSGISYKQVSCRNLESIHTHDAYAELFENDSTE